MKRLSVILILLSVYFLHSQGILTNNKMSGAAYCSQKKINSTNITMLEKANIPHSFDVLDYKVNLDIYSCFLSPYPKTFNASVIITLRADSSLSFITLNATSTSLQIDSVRLAGASFTHSSNILKVFLDKTYNPGDTLRVRINYKHKDISDGAVYVSGGFFFTDCEPEGARKWLPCWDKPSDKATLDLTAKTPGTVKLGSNGRLADSTKSGDTITYHWVSRDPVATYLMVVSAKVNYNLDIVYWKNPSTGENIPFRFYYNSGENPSSLEPKVIAMVGRYSELFGIHPFEKNGFATLNSQFSWGGMENQTLTSLCPNCWEENLISHEFAHQWFGDMITCATWADIFLNEGFATYAEALWYEYTSGYSGYKSAINSNASSYIGGNPGWAIYNASWVTATPDVNTLFNTPITYDKGACVLHMLRYTLGDSVFFAGIKAYTSDPTLRLKSATIEDFKNVMSTVAKQDLSWFFDSWIKQANHPAYANKYFITSLGSGYWNAGLLISQTQTNTPFHPMPVEITFTFASGADTTVRVFNSVNNQQFTFRFTRQPLTVVFDPNDNIVIKSASLSSMTAGAALNSPQNSSTIATLNPQFSWTAINGATAYNLQVATDEVFTAIIKNDSNITSASSQAGPLDDNKTYFWRVRAKVSGQYTAFSETWKFATNTTTRVTNFTAARDYSLEQNYPNPFNPTTVFRFSIPAESVVTLTIYNELGQVVSTLVDGNLSAGTHAIEWNAQSFVSGVYFYKLTAGSFTAVKKLLLMK